MVRIKPGKYNAGDVTLQVSFKGKETAIVVHFPDQRTYRWIFNEEGVFLRMSVLVREQPSSVVRDVGTVMACPHIDERYKGRIFVSCGKGVPLTKAGCPSCCDHKIRLPEGRLNLLTSEAWEDLASRCEVIPIEE